MDALCSRVKSKQWSAFDGVADPHLSLPDLAGCLRRWARTGNRQLALLRSGSMFAAVAFFLWPGFVCQGARLACGAVGAAIRRLARVVVCRGDYVLRVSCNSSRAELAAGGSGKSED